MRILIIGGAGFIGSHLVNLLNNNYEHELVVVDNLSSGSRDNISSAIKFYEMDIRDNDLEKIFMQDSMGPRGGVGESEPELENEEQGYRQRQSDMSPKYQFLFYSPILAL